MIKLENVEVLGWEHAIRGMRNPMNSWEKSDSCRCVDHVGCEGCAGDGGSDIGCTLPGLDPFVIGPNDHQLMMSLAKGGPVHAKYRRMITVYLDITAPLYWWKEFDTYKVGTVANSCSTMHKIHAKEFELGDFSHEHLLDCDAEELPGEDMFPALEYEDDEIIYREKWDSVEVLKVTITALNHYRKKYLEAKTKPMKEEAKRAGLMKKYWWQMIQLLPSSYNQKRTVMLNYEVLHNIYHSRRHHKLDEWHVLCDMIENLPYSEIIIGEKE